MEDLRGVLQYGIESGAHELEAMETDLIPDQGSHCRSVRADATALRKQVSKDVDPDLSGQPICAVHGCCGPKRWCDFVAGSAAGSGGRNFVAAFFEQPSERPSHNRPEHCTACHAMLTAHVTLASTQFGAHMACLTICCAVLLQSAGASF